MRSTVPHQEKGKDEVAHLYLGTEWGWDVRGVTQMEHVTPVRLFRFPQSIQGPLPTEPPEHS